MNKIYLYLFYISVLFGAIVIQSTFLSPQNTGVFYVDYSLISVIYIALIPEISGLILFAFFCGYTIDVLSAADIGIYTISRLSLYILLRMLVTKVYSDRFFVEFGIIILSVIYERILLYLVTVMGSTTYVDLPLGFVIKNILINAIIGYIFFMLLKQINERIKT